MLTRIRLERFTAFERLDVPFNPGINVFVGANGTGKSHLLKVGYAACEATRPGANFSEKLIRLFLPSNRAIGRLVKRQQGSSRAVVEVWRGDLRLRVSFSNHSKVAASATVTGRGPWAEESLESVFIPVKEMLSHGPGFRSLYGQREIHFEEIYADILDRAYRPALRGPIDRTRRGVLTSLQKAIAGKVTSRSEEFFLRNRHGNLEFTLLAEGMRKLGLLWLLVQNGTLLEGSVLFWDEPEANLNPSVFHVLIDILLQLQRIGVQVLIATHDYAILKELELLAESEDQVRFHALYRRDTDGEIECESAARPFLLENSPIAAAYRELHDREIGRFLQRENL